MRQEVVLRVRGDDLRVPLVEQRKRATRRADIDRLPEAVQDQNLSIQECRVQTRRRDNIPLAVCQRDKQTTPSVIPTEVENRLLFLVRARCAQRE